MSSYPRIRSSFAGFAKLGLAGQIALGLFLGLVAIFAFEATSLHHGIHIDIEGFDGRHTIRFFDDDRRLTIKTRGEIEFLDDESGIARLGPRGEIEITDRPRGGTRQRLVVTRGADGEPQHTFYRGRKEVEFDAEAKAWLAEQLPRIFRASGIDAEGRVARIYARGGADAVLEEVEVISGDHVQRLYLGHLAGLDIATGNERVNALTTAAAQIESDYEMGELLRSLEEADLEEPEVREAWIAAAQTVGSDYELRRTLIPRVEGGDPAWIAAALDTTKGIKSAYELAEVLVAIAQPSWDGTMPTSFVDALERIPSDHEQARVVAEVIDRQEINTELLDILLGGLRGIDSSYERSQLLQEIATAYPPGASLPPIFFERLTEMGSQYEARQVLSRIVEDRDLDHATSAAMLDAFGSLSSGYELAQHLRALADAYPIVEEMRPEVERLAARIDSSHERDKLKGDLGL